MDKDRDTNGQVNSKLELQSEMERTRQSMSETLGEIEGEISHALDWRTYLKRYPGAFLIGAGAIGFIVGRAITGPGYSPNARPAHGRAAAFDGDRSPKFSSEDSSIRRVIDMTVSALLAQAVPIVSSKLRNLLGVRAAGGRGGKS